MTFAENLRRIREEVGLTQVELADKSGLRLDSIRNWEQGKASPKIDALAKLAAALGVSIDAFAVGLTDEPEKKARKASKGRKGKAT